MGTLHRRGHLSNCVCCEITFPIVCDQRKTRQLVVSSLKRTNSVAVTKFRKRETKQMNELLNEMRCAVMSACGDGGCAAQDSQLRQMFRNHY